MDPLERHHRKDITDTFVRAAASAEPWTSDDVRDTLRALCSAVGDANADWDERAGEGWGRIIRSGQVIAYVCAWLPVVVVTQDVAERVRDAVPQCATVLKVAGMSNAEFVVDQRALEELYGGQLRSQFDPRCFSADDLWYATV